MDRKRTKFILDETKGHGKKEISGFGGAAGGGVNAKIFEMLTL